VGATSGTAIWYWWDSSANSGAGGWVIADGTLTQTNSAATINSNMGAFSTQVGTGTVYVKAFLKSSGSSTCELSDIELDGKQ
jgi:hypothetical protein